MNLSVKEKLIQLENKVDFVWKNWELSLTFRTVS